MNAPSSPIRRRNSASLFVVVFALGCSLLSLKAAPGSDAPLTKPAVQTLFTQRKITADQVKMLEADITAVTTAQKNLEAFKSSLSAEQGKLPANQQKEKGLQQQVIVAQQQLSADQAKLAPGTIRYDDESPKERKR